MVDQKTFTETLQAVQEIARASEGPLKRDEVLFYFKDMELSKEQEEMVYQYFLNHPQDETKEESSELLKASQEQKEAEEQFLSSAYVQMYLDDIKNIKKIPESEMQKHYDAAASGDESAITIVVNNYLHQVVEMAKQYVLLGVNMQDLVQEGNMGLLMAVHSLAEGKTENAGVHIEEQIKKAMEAHIDEVLADVDWENVVLQRATLLHEAEAALAKELVRIPTIEELSEYTRLDIKEIEDIRALIKEKEAK